MAQRFPQAGLLLVCALVMVLCVITLDAQVTVAFSETPYASRSDHVTFSLPDDTTQFKADQVYQFGHASECQFLFAGPQEVPIDQDFMTCFISGDEKKVKVGALQSSCDKFDADQEAKIAFTLTVDQDLPVKSTLVCAVQYAQDPLIARKDAEAILFRQVAKEAVQKQQNQHCDMMKASPSNDAPVELESKYKPFVQYTTTTTLVSIDYLENIVTFKVDTPAAGLFKFTYNTQVTSLSTSDTFCYAKRSDGELATAGRLYIDKDSTLYLHKILGPLAAEPITCTLSFSPVNKGIFQAATLLQLERGTPYESQFQFDNIIGSKIAKIDTNVPSDAGAPEKGTVNVNFWIPAGIKSGAKFFLEFTDIVKPTPTTHVAATYFVGYTDASELPKDFTLMATTKDNSGFFGVVYNGAEVLATATVVTVKFTYNEKSFPSQADIRYVIKYSDVDAPVVTANQAAFDALYPLPEKQSKSQLHFIRAVLRNELTQHDIIQNGWAMNFTTTVTAYLNTVDFQENWGWATIFYLTDSYNSVRRAHTCRITTDASLPISKWDEPKTYSDFGTIYVFTKEVLAPGKKVYINCVMPLLYRDLAGFVPEAGAKHPLRIATWSYDKTVESGENIFEDNHSHSIVILEPKESPQTPAAVFKFNTPGSVIYTETSFISHYNKVLAAMSAVVDADTKKPIFNGNLHSESVYSILNYQFLNGTGTQFGPYSSPLDGLATLNSAAATSALAVQTYDTFTVEYLLKYKDELNTAIAQFDTIITDIVVDRAYLDSNGIAACGSPTQRKCLVGGKQYNSSSCGGNGEASTEGCTLNPVVYNPFKNNSIVSSTFMAIVAVVLTVLLQ